MCRNYVRDNMRNFTKLREVSIISKVETRDRRTGRSEWIKNRKCVKNIKPHHAHICKADENINLH